MAMAAEKQMFIEGFLNPSKIGPSSLGMKTILIINTGNKKSTST
jgi:hypothetical protein